jgi:dTDP-4-dehydrorhamnose reductase
MTWTNRTILLIGGTGMLGRAMTHELLRRGLRFVAPSPEALDLTRVDHINTHIATGDIGTVINCAAYTDVDGAETHEALATAINGTAMAHLAAACKSARATLVNYGTDYIFDGDGTAPYAATQPRNPINAYGRSKAAGEEALERSGARYLQIRTSWLYAPWAKNFVRTIAKLGREKPMLKVVDDQRGRPTSAEHLAQATLALLDKDATGILAVTDSTPTERGISWFEFAAEIVRLTGGTAKVEPCTSAEFPRPAKRPAYSVLDLTPATKLIGPRPDWKVTLADVCRRLEW